MRCLTDERCKAWMQGRGLALPEEHSNYVAERVSLKEWHSFPVANGWPISSRAEMKRSYGLPSGKSGQAAKIGISTTRYAGLQEIVIFS